MKTQEMFATLRAFADLAESGRAYEVRRLAGLFDGGKDEAVSVRVKRALANLPQQRAHPGGLRKALVAMASGFAACGANKQAKDIEIVLSLFDGAGTAPVESFVDQIAAALVTPPTKGSRRGDREQAPDHALARQLAEDLARAVLDVEAFARIVERLRDSRLVSTPTLGAVANQFLGNGKRYSGRKPAIDDIMNRQKQDARSHARSKALDRIGV